MKKLLLSVVILVMAGCSKPNDGAPGSSGHNMLTTKAPASVIDCPAGGTTLSYGLDMNNDNVLESVEVTGSTSMCNGVAGNNGHNMMTSQVPATLLECPSGGTTLKYGMDMNDNNVLDSSEITGNSPVCNGLNGNNGHNTLTAQTPASALICPEGGATLSYGTDLNDNNTLDSSEVAGSSSVCNGVTGSTGQQGPAGNDGTSVVGVKFCSSVGDSSFPEYGLCIGNKIYAVYWSGSTSFLAYLAPNHYTTTSIGSNCSFYVTAGSCTISH